MFIGQFVFDYTDRNGKIWHNYDGETLESEPTDDSPGNHDSNLVLAANKGAWTAVGVQGPVGLTFYINNMPFILGHTGIYEIEDYKITSFSLQDANVTQTIIDFKGE